jgi:hypothetical protein
LIAFSRKLLKSAYRKKHGKVVKWVPQVCSPRLAQIIESQRSRSSGGLYDVSAVPEHVRRPKRPVFNRNHDAIRQGRGFEESETALTLLISAEEKRLTPAVRYRIDFFDFGPTLTQEARIRLTRFSRFFRPVFSRFSRPVFPFPL